MASPCARSGSPNAIPRNLLLTGPSGAGKSTLLKRLREEFRDYQVGGVYSDVLMERGTRVGWEIAGYGGDRALLAHKGIESSHSMGSYGVDMAALHAVALPELELRDERQFYLIDEIGIVSSWSPPFQEAATKLLDSPKPVVAIVRQKPTAYADGVKERADVEMLELTTEAREGQLLSMIDWLRHQLGSSVSTDS